MNQISNSSIAMFPGVPQAYQSKLTTFLRRKFKECDFDNSNSIDKLEFRELYLYVL